MVHRHYEQRGNIHDAGVVPFTTGCYHFDGAATVPGECYRYLVQYQSLLMAAFAVAI